VAVSATDQGNYGVGVGGRLMTTSTDHPRPAALRITGVYRADAGDPVWYGVTPTGRSRPGELGGAGDTVFTPRATFEQETWGHTSSAQSAALPGRLRLDDLPALVDWVNGINPSLDAMGGVTLRTQLPDVVNRISDGRRQAVSIIPLVMIQVAIFGLVVLALTAGAVIDQRRPELAIGRLRGRGAARAGREVFAEMGLLVTIGTVAGFAVAFVVTTAVRSTLR
jgi:hypothetical protein